MTDIRNMPAGMAMNRKVATDVMGWHVEEAPLGVEVYSDADGTFMGCVSDLEDDAWCPSTDIAAAWEVVERFRRGDINGPDPLKVSCCMDLNLYDTIQMPDWRCSFSSPCLAEHEAFGNSAPLAICRAALLAVEGNRD